MELIRLFCGGSTRYEILSADNPSMKLA